MQVLAIYAVYEHISELMAEAEMARLARADKPRRSIRARVTSLLTGRSSAPAPAATAYANC